MEILIIALAWAVPLGAAVFVVAALWQILRAMGEITVELARIREALEGDRHP